MGAGPEIYDFQERQAYDSLGVSTGHTLIAMGRLASTLPSWPMDGNGHGPGAGPNIILDTIFAIERYLRILEEILAIEKSKTHRRKLPPPPPERLKKKAMAKRPKPG